MKQVRLSELIAPSFYDLFYDIEEHRHTFYWLKGGRGSTKSSFASIDIILGMLRNAKKNCVILRRYASNLRDSVFEQMRWAIERLGVSDLFSIHVSPMEIIRKDTGQKILFRGADDPTKIKSLKVSNGYIAYVWYEETAQFRGMSEIRSINQSLLRGGEQFTVFYTYNPPASVRNWINTEVLEQKNNNDSLVHHSSYIDVPKEWLGERFILDAEHLKTANPTLYAHEYMGEVTGTGGEIFTNVDIKTISDSEIDAFDKIREGIDFGFSTDPFVYIKCHFDSKRRRLYIFDEIYKFGMSNLAASRLIIPKKNTRGSIIADSAEPKSINEMRRYGLSVRGAKKGPDSVEYGIKFLASLDSIVIDNIRCPNAAREFLNYELEPDGNDGFKDGYPDRDNHTIDAVRYALEDDMANHRAKIITKRDFYL